MNKQTRKLIRGIAKYIFLTAIGIALFKVAAADAAVQRGYQAIGGEYVLLLLPLFYWVFTNMAKDLFREYVEIFAEWKKERQITWIVTERGKRLAKKGQSRMMCKNSGAELAIIPGLLGGLSDEELNALSAEAKKLGESTKISASEAAVAIVNMSMAGWNSNQITESTSLMEKSNENLTDQFIKIIGNGKEETPK